MRKLLALSFATLFVTSFTMAQDGPLRRAGQALDNAGKSIRYRVETEVTRGQVLAQERNLLYRVMRRIEWDKQLVGSALQVESGQNGAIVLRGSVASEAAKRRAVDLVENTVGVTAVVDAMGVAREVKVIESRTVVPPAPVDPEVIVTPNAVVPSETKVIVKP